MPDPASTFRLTEDQILLRDAVRTLADDKIAPRAAAIDRDGEFPHDVKDLLAQHDILALPFPEQYGGVGADLLTVCLAIEELSRVDATTGLILAVQELGALPILLAGTEEQKQRWLPDLAAGRRLIAFALTEFAAGSDPAATRTRAVRADAAAVPTPTTAAADTSAIPAAAAAVPTTAAHTSDAAEENAGTDEVSVADEGRTAAVSADKAAAPTAAAPGAADGSAADVADVADVAGDHYILNGSKRFISHASVADLLIVFAVTNPEADKPSRRLSAFVVDTNSPGFAVTRLEHKMGIRGSPTAELTFDSVMVPAENRLGQEGEGFGIAMRTFERSRPGIAAQAVGIAQGATDAAVQYSKERIQFGKPIAELQMIQAMLADMAAQTEAARALLYRACAEIEYGPGADAARWAAMCKLVAGDTAMRVATDAVQVLGGYGYIEDFPVERMMRDAKITQLYEGTQQIQRLVIARALLRGRDNESDGRR